MFPRYHVSVPFLGRMRAILWDVVVCRCELDMRAERKGKQGNGKGMRKEHVLSPFPFKQILTAVSFSFLVKIVKKKLERF